MPTTHPRMRTPAPRYPPEMRARVSCGQARSRVTVLVSAVHADLGLTTVC